VRGQSGEGGEDPRENAGHGLDDDKDGWQGGLGNAQKKPTGVFLGPHKTQTSTMKR